jgi:hypothetical protein
MRANVEGNRFRDCRWGKGLFLETMEYVPADNFVLSADSPPMIFLAPAGAVDVLMPTSNAARKGLTFFICNNSGGANTITLKTDGDAAFTVPIVIAQNEFAMVVCTGSTTQASGWRHFTGVI